MMMMVIVDECVRLYLKSSIRKKDQLKSFSVVQALHKTERVSFLNPLSKGGA